MLLWEALRTSCGTKASHVRCDEPAAARRVRLPFDRHCAAITKSGKRCRGKILPGTEFCLFHDPACAEKRRQSLAHRSPRRSRLAHLPDGYLRKLTNRAAVGQAMDRLYREVRLGVVTPEMGGVLFNVLTRILDAGLYREADATSIRRRPGKADRLRPKLAELLTAAERTAWRKAISNAPPRLLFQPPGALDARPPVLEPPASEVVAVPSRLALQAS